jgi:5'-methylthioadenosine nucleosidase
MAQLPGRVLIQFAMEKEAEAFLALAQAPALMPLRPGFPYLSTLIESRFPLPVAVTVGGRDPRFGVEPIGTVHASLQATFGIDRFKPGLLLNAGTAGGYQKHGAALGEVFVGAEYAVYHDRRIGLPQFEEYCRGRFPVADLKAFVDHPFRTGIVSSGDSLDCPAEDQRRIDANGASLKDMEAAAIGLVCEKLNVPFVPVKSVTDFVDHHEETTEQFIKNLELATRNLAQALVRILEGF